jgi:hypothetical protein
MSNLPDARRLFDEMHQRDVVSWTSMLSAYAMGALLFLVSADPFLSNSLLFASLAFLPRIQRMKLIS